MSPQAAAVQVAGRADAAKIWGPMSLVSTLDQRLPDKAYRILGLIAPCSWSKPAELGYDQIGEAVNCSRRSAMRHVALLESLKYIAVKRKHNKANLYAVNMDGIYKGKPKATVAKSVEGKPRVSTTVRLARSWAEVPDIDSIMGKAV